VLLFFVYAGRKWRPAVPQLVPVNADPVPRICQFYKRAGSVCGAIPLPQFLEAFLQRGLGMLAEALTGF